MYVYFLKTENFHKMVLVIKPFLKPNNWQVVSKIREVSLKKEKKKENKTYTNRCQQRPCNETLGQIRSTVCAALMTNPCCLSFNSLERP